MTLTLAAVVGLLTGLDRELVASEAVVAGLVIRVGRWRGAGCGDYQLFSSLHSDSAPLAGRAVDLSVSSSAVAKVSPIHGPQT